MPRQVIRPMPVILYDLHPQSPAVLIGRDTATKVRKEAGPLLRKGRFGDETRLPEPVELWTLSAAEVVAIADRPGLEVVPLGYGLRGTGWWDFVTIASDDRTTQRDGIRLRYGLGSLGLSTYARRHGLHVEEVCRRLAREDAA